MRISIVGIEVSITASWVAIDNGVVVITIEHI
jgi:hypothetical protein